MFATEHPQTSGLVERVNRTINLAFAAYVNVKHDDWDYRKTRKSETPSGFERRVVKDLYPNGLVLVRRKLNKKCETMVYQLKVGEMSSARGLPGSVMDSGGKAQPLL